MRKPKANQLKLQQKRARKAAKRKKIVKEKMRIQREREVRINAMDEDELREFLGDEYDECDDECDEDCEHEH